MKVKVCGMRDGENIRQVRELGVDYIGMIFWSQSPRCVNMQRVHAGIIPDRAAPGAQPSDHSVQTVGVFVDEMPQNIITRVVQFNLDVVQLHGHETPILIRNLRDTLITDIHPGLQFWKAVPVDPANPHLLAETCAAYEDCVDAFLFDALTPLAGGSGQHYDWSLLDAYQGVKPFMLSGGLGPDDAERLRCFRHPRFMGIDLNSRFETEPGIKDVEKLKQFLTQL